jgi:hypothetical protein
MAKYVIEESTLKNIANAIRNVNGETKQYSPDDMAAKVPTIRDKAYEDGYRSGYEAGSVTYVNAEEVAY